MSANTKATSVHVPFLGVVVFINLEFNFTLNEVGAYELDEISYKTVHIPQLHSFAIYNSGDNFFTQNFKKTTLNEEEVFRMDQKIRDYVAHYCDVEELYPDDIELNFGAM